MEIKAVFVTHYTDHVVCPVHLFYFKIITNAKKLNSHMGKQWRENQPKLKMP